MANTTPTPPGTMGLDATVGTIDWTDPNNSKVSDNTYSTVTLTGAQTSKYLVATNFGFTIPTGATIDGITFSVEGKISAETWVLDYARIIKGGSIGSTNLTITGFSTTESTQTVGSSTNKWGETWTAADINSNDFGIAISTFLNTGTYTFSLDQILCTVYYTYSSIPIASVKTVNGLAIASVKTIDGLAIASVKTMI